MKHTRNFLTALAVSVGILSAMAAAMGPPRLQSGPDSVPPVSGDWQDHQVPPSVSLTADKLSIGLDVTPEELAAYELYISQLVTNNKPNK